MYNASDCTIDFPMSVSEGKYCRQESFILEIAFLF